MSQVFVYEGALGSVVVGSPSPQALSSMTIEEIAILSTPPGTTTYITDTSSLPFSSGYLNSWVFTTPPSVEVDLDKAKVEYKTVVDYTAAGSNSSLTEQYVVLLATGGDTTPVQAQIVAISNAASDTAYLSATTPEELTSYWPAILGPNPFAPAVSGTMSISRTGLDFNDSYYITFDSTYLVEDDTELFIPATSTVIPYILPTQFAGTSEAFGSGNYTIQIRQSSTGLILAEFVCPEAPALPVPF